MLRAASGWRAVFRLVPKRRQQERYLTLAPPLANSILDTIGNTPLVRLDRLCKTLGLDEDAAILAKLENINPGMSKKDRIAYEIIRQAKESGQLKEGQPVVELTSGNTGCGLAIVCQQLGHPFCAVISAGNSKERSQMMQFFGAVVVQVQQAPGSLPNQVSGEDLELVETAAQEICQKRNAFRVDQFERSANADAHYHGTAKEILEQAHHNIDGFVDFVGTGGSFAGIARRFKEELENVQCCIVEPAGIAPLADKYGNDNMPQATATTTKNHVIQGGGYDRNDLTLLEDSIEKGHVDGFLQVTNEEATDMARLLAVREGIFGGFSAGANVHAAAQLIRQGRATNVVALICDSGSKYYSANLLPNS